MLYRVKITSLDDRELRFAKQIWSSSSEDGAIAYYTYVGAAQSRAEAEAKAVPYLSYNLRVEVVSHALPTSPETRVKTLRDIVVPGGESAVPFQKSKRTGLHKRQTLVQLTAAMIAALLLALVPFPVSGLDAEAWVPAALGGLAVLVAIGLARVVLAKRQKARWAHS